MKTWQLVQHDDGTMALKFAQPIREGKALDAVLAGLWLIEPDAFARVLAIAATAGDNPKLAEAGGWFLEEPRAAMEIADGTALISVTGPIFPKANLMTKHSGATPLSAVERDFRAAMADPAVERIVMQFDTPGGVATGVSSLAEAIYAARGVKPVTAVAQDLAASAGFWLASAAEEFVLTPTSFVGSIGVVMTAYRSQKFEDEIVIVSSQSPKKRQDPSSESGRADLQALVDSMASEFVDAVATHRGTTAQDVMDNFGKGGVVAARAAIAVGMADGISSRQQIVGRTEAPTMSKQTLTAQQVAADFPDVAATLRAEGASQATDANATAVAQARADGAKAELERVRSVMAVPAIGHEALIHSLAIDGKTTAAEAALKVLAAEQQARGTALDQRRTDAPPPVKVITEQEEPPVAQDSARAEWDKKPQLREEFDSFEQYEAYSKANAAGRVKVLKGKAAA